MTAVTPPSPIWQDEKTGLAVHVNGGLIELSMGIGDGWSGRMLPSEVENIGADLTAAIAEATTWTERWDIVTGCYAESAA